MAIKKKFIHFKKKESFQRELDAGNILSTSIVFIADAKQIYLNGSYFSENTLFNLSELLDNASGELKETDTTNEAVVKLYKKLQDVLSGDVDVIKLLAEEIYNLEVSLNERIDTTDEVVAAGLADLNNRVNNALIATESQIENLEEKLDKKADADKYLPLTGGTMKGPVVVPEGKENGFKFMTEIEGDQLTMFDMYGDGDSLHIKADSSNGGAYIYLESEVGSLAIGDEGLSTFKHTNVAIEKGALYINPPGIPPITILEDEDILCPNLNADLLDGKHGNEYAAKTDLDVVETLTKSVNTGLGEAILRVDDLETSLAADKENLKNFKESVEETYVKDKDYNKDKETIVGQIMAQKDYTDNAIATYLDSSPEQLKTINEIRQRLSDDEDLANALTAQIATKQDILTDSDDVAVVGSQLILSAAAKRQWLIDTWNRVCSISTAYISNWTVFDVKYDNRYNPETGYFQLNGINDIGDEEALLTLSCFFGGYISRTGVRTMFPLIGKYNGGSHDGSAFSRTEIEVINDLLGPTLSITYNNKLREVNAVAIYYNGSLTIQSSALEYIRFGYQNNSALPYKSFDIRYASKFRLDGMQNIVRWIRDCTAIVHADVFAKLTGDTTNAAAAALSEEELAEWIALYETATSNGLIIITP